MKWRAVVSKVVTPKAETTAATESKPASKISKGATSQGRKSSIYRAVGRRRQQTVKTRKR